MQITKGFFSILNASGIYSLLQSIIMSSTGMRSITRHHIAPSEGMNILDIGCGPADILSYIIREQKAVQYYGFDLSPIYIKTAQQRYGDNGHFFCASVTDSILLPDIKFNVILMLGVLHHLSDVESVGLMPFVKSKLTLDGRFITLDPCFVTPQNKLSQFLIRHDRGRNVRTPEEYQSLVSAYFTVNGTHTNFNRVPYDHWLMECTNTTAW